MMSVIASFDRSRAFVLKRLFSNREFPLKHRVVVQILHQDDAFSAVSPPSAPLILISIEANSHF